MKKQGIVIDYNGYNGIIETDMKEQFILLREEIVNAEELKKLDIVSFVEDVNKKNTDYKIARFVRKLVK